MLPLPTGLYEQLLTEALLAESSTLKRIVRVVDESESADILGALSKPSDGGLVRGRTADTSGL